MRRRFLAQAAGLAGLAAVPSLFAQTSFPNRPIRIIVPFPPGGSVDPIARVVGLKLGELLGQPVVVDNRTGGNTSIAAGAVAKAAPDGHTLLVTAASTHIIHTLQAPNLPYDSIKDFAPVASLSKSAYMMVVHPSVPANSLAEFIAYAKANPGRLNYASSGIGNANHLAGELFNVLAEVKTTHIPYKGGGPALMDLLAGRVHFMFNNVSTVQGAVEKGQLKALAYTTQQPDMPPVPTFSQSGLTAFETIESVNILLAPAGTPETILRTLSEAVAKAVTAPEVKAAMATQRQHPFVLTPDQLGARLRAEQAQYTRVIKDADIKLTS